MTITKTADVDIAALAASHLAAADNDVQAATLTLYQAALEDLRIEQALTRPLLRSACYDALRAECRRERRNIWTAPNYSKAGNGQRVQQLARRLMDFPLPGGKRLAHATREEVLAAADSYTKQATRMQQIGVWLSRIADRVEEGTVADSLTEAELVELQGAE